MLGHRLISGLGATGFDRTRVDWEPDRQQSGISPCGAGFYSRACGRSVIRNHDRLGYSRGLAGWSQLVGLHSSVLPARVESTNSDMAISDRISERRSA